MSKINLLPWREERRKEQKQQFVTVLAIAAVTGFGGIYAINMQVESQIAHQQARNEFVRQETTALDTRIAEIAELKKKRERLVDRMNVIQNLQGNRPLIVHVFDELAKGVPDGVFFTEIEQKGAGIAASGMAESNTRISNLMRNLDASASFAKPVLSKVETQTGAAAEKQEDKAWSGFSMSFQIDQQDRTKAGECWAMDVKQFFDWFNNLDMENIGSWPMPVKVVAWLFAMVLVGYGTHMNWLATSLETLDMERATESELMQEYERKAFQAANLDRYKAQMVDMENTFGALLRQLPKDAEVPGLLEDITQTGLSAGLTLESITLADEISQEFYIELPINIKVSGGYHALGAFVSGVAALPRIVTLHDFKITSGEGNSDLTMEITAKTYRYKEE